MESLTVNLSILSKIFSKMPSVRANSNKLYLKKYFWYLQVFIIFLLISITWSFINLLWIKARFINSVVVRTSYICALLTFIHHIWLYLIISNRGGDIEKNPGQKPNSSQKFSICQWNLNSISAHNFLKLSLLQAYITVHNSDIICLSET